MAKPYAIKIFLPFGEPKGLRILERHNWTGVGVSFLRTGFKEALARPELNRAGVYILIGDPDESSTFPKIYIGEGDPVIDRLKSHNTDPKKDFWTAAVVFSSKDSSLNKAHIQYLESRLLDLANLAKLCDLENGQKPQLPSLSEADLADSESYLENMLEILPLVELSIFDKIEIAQDQQASADYLYLTKRNIKAKAIQNSSGFVVLKGSQFVVNMVPSCRDNIKNKRNDLYSKNIIKDSDAETGIFLENVAFTSPSMAASFLLGFSSNGLAIWKNDKEQSLKELQIIDAQ